MAKITRQTLLPFGSSGPTNDFEQFGSTEGGSPNFTKVIATIQSLTAWLTGWRAALVTAKAPVLQDMNAVCYVFGYMLNYILQQGIAEWDSGTTYYQNSLVMRANSNELYASAIDTNVGNALPNQVQDSNWVYLGALQSIYTSGLYRRPNLVSTGSSTTCTVEKLSASGALVINFPDGYQLLDSTAGHVTLDVTRVASLGASPQSGLRTGTVANNTWYAVYAVKANSGANVVLVADVTLPLQANIATINGFYGANSWVYLGLIRYGDGSGSPSGIVNFVQCGNKTKFINVSDGGATGFIAEGVRMAHTAGATTLGYSYASGTGAAQIPANVPHTLWTICSAALASSYISVLNSLNTKGFTQYASFSASTAAQRLETAALDGVSISNGASSSIAYDIWLSGYVDQVLGIGYNPQV